MNFSKSPGKSDVRTGIPGAGRLRPQIIYRLKRQENPLVRPKVQNGQKGMFRYLDSNQDNRIQSSASCQLLNTGLEATDISGMRYLLLTPEYRSRRSGAKHWAEHGDSSPTFDPAVEIAAPPDVDPQAPAVALSNVLTHGLRVMALQRGTAKLAGLRVRGVQPEPLGRLNVCGLV
jgi:hypothetical protein